MVGTKWVQMGFQYFENQTFSNKQILKIIMYCLADVFSIGGVRK